MLIEFLSDLTAKAFADYLIHLGLRKDSITVEDGTVRVDYVYNDYVACVMLRKFDVIAPYLHRVWSSNVILPRILKGADMLFECAYGNPAVRITWSEKAYGIRLRVAWRKDMGFEALYDALLILSAGRSVRGDAYE